MTPRGPSEDPKVTALRESRCLNPHPEHVADEAFLADGFFDARDAVQVKYEMVRRVSVDGAPVTATAAAFGYSRPSYYQAAAALADCAAASSGSATPACSPWPRWPSASACPPKPSRSGTTPGSSPATPSTTKASASTRRMARTRQPAHRDANSANDASPAAPLPQTRREPARNVGPHRYCLQQHNNRTPRINPKRCSMQPEGSPAVTGSES